MRTSTRKWRLLLAVCAAVAMLAAFTVTANAETTYTADDKVTTVTFDHDKEARVEDGFYYLTLKSPQKAIVVNVKVAPPQGKTIENVICRAKKGHNTDDFCTDFDFVANKGQVTVKACGTYNLLIKYTDGSSTNLNFYAGPVRPTRIKITTYADRIMFNTNALDPMYYGDETRVIDKSNGDVYNMKQFWQEDQQLTGLKPGKTYSYIIAGYYEDENTGYWGYGDAMDIKLTTGSKTTPVIKSVKISNVKRTKYFDKQYWEYRYNISYKMTVTLSKKAKNSNGVIMNIGYGGMTGAQQKVIKTSKNTFSTTVNINSVSSYSNQKVKVQLATYQNKTYKVGDKKYTYQAVSGQSKVKSAKLK